MPPTIAVSLNAQTARIALLTRDALTEYHIWRLNNPDSIGDIYTARLTAKAPTMAGSFLDLGQNQTGFLPNSAAPKNLTEGAYLTVTVTRSPQSGKSYRLAALATPPTNKPGLIARGAGPLIELSTRFPTAPIIINDHALIATLPAHLKSRTTYNPNAFDPILEDEIDTLSSPTAPLPHGAQMHITPTPALTAIDIDSAQATAQSLTHLTLNQSLIPEIVRQIILRNLSGGIIIDFAGMKSAARPKLAPALTAALSTDPLNPKFLGFSHLGFAELTRPRIRPPLHELITP